MIKGFHIPFWLNEEQIIEIGKKCIEPGYFSWIEIKWPQNYLGVDSNSYIRGIHHLVDTYDVGVSTHIPTNLDLGQTNIGMKKEVVKQIKECIEYAHSFDAKILPIHPGTILTMDIPISNETSVKQFLIQEGLNKKKKARNLTIDILKEISDYASKYEMTIAVENLLLPQEIAHTADELLEIVTLTNRKNVKTLYDCGHAFRVGEDVGEFVKKLGTTLCHCHFNDNDGTCDLHLQVEKGSIDYDTIFFNLAKINYKGALVLETSYEDSKDLIEGSHILDKYITRYFKKKETKNV